MSTRLARAITVHLAWWEDHDIWDGYALYLDEDTAKSRAVGGPYDAQYAITQHPPGPGLVQPCPFHRWKALTARDGQIFCPCDTELTSPDHERHGT